VWAASQKNILKARICEAIKRLNVKRTVQSQIKSESGWEEEFSRFQISIVQDEL
jgi:hypothetical protein